MNVLDIILLALLVFGVVKGIIKGFVLEAASLFGVILGVYAAKIYSSSFAYSLHHWFDLSVKYIVPVAFFLIFIFSIIIFHLLAKIIDKTVKINMLKKMNQFLGALFSLLKYAFLISIFLNVFQAIDEKAHFIKESKKNDSLLYYPIKSLVPTVFPYVVWEDFVKNENN